MKIWMIVAVCAFVFLVCFLLDTLFKHLFPKSAWIWPTAAT